MLKREVLAPVMLFGLLTIIGGGFALFNFQLRGEHRELVLHGVATFGIIERVIYSHNACNSSVVVSYHDLGNHLWRQRFQTCIANHVVGESLGVTYLRAAPSTAMLRSGESPYTEDMLRRGLLIGAVLALFGTVMIVRTFCRPPPNYTSGK
jgi:hypothetical protein